MSGVRPRNQRKSGSSGACDECRRRKVKCSAEPQCANCVRDRKTCIYSSPWSIIKSLQKDVRHLKSMLEDVRRLWAVHIPDLSLERALSQNYALSSSSPTASEPTGTSHPYALPSPPLIGQHTAEIGGSSVTDGDTPEQNNAEDFEYDETQDYDSDEQTDGMGSLPVHTAFSGYTGSLAGSSVLKFLSLPPSDPSPRPGSGSGGGSGPSQTAIRTGAHQDAADVDGMINDYFTYFHPAYPLLHEGLFRARAAGIVPKPRDGSWPLLFNMVIAMGGFVGDSNASNRDLDYYYRARDSVPLTVLEKGSLSYVQGFMIMANYIQKRNRPNAGFVMIGIAWSMALCIGLHREFEASPTSPFTMESRRRTWWTLFIFVSGAQLTFGRPPASLAGIDIRLPSNVPDSELSVDMDSLPPPHEHPTSASCLIEQVKLAIIGNDVQAELLASHIPDARKAALLDERIVKWGAAMPNFLRKEQALIERFDIARRVLLWRSFHLRIVLNRPFLFQAVARKEGLTDTNHFVKTCLDAAAECSTAIFEFFQYREIPRRGFAWYSTYWLITASFVQAICLTYAPKHPAAHAWRGLIERAILTLHKFGTAHAMAARAQKLLKSLLATHESSAADTGAMIDSLMQAPAVDLSINSAEPTVDSQELANSAFKLGGADDLAMPAFDAVADRFWMWENNGANAEFVDATGGFVFQDF